MSDTARDLVNRMVAAGEWPEPALFDELLQQGEQAVEPLREVLRRDVHGWPDEAPFCHAIDLLGSLKATTAIPDLVSLFYRYDNETIQSAAATLGQLGPEALEAALAIVRDPSANWYCRSEAINAAILAAGEDLEQDARITTTLRELLADDLNRAGELSEDEREMVGTLVDTLTTLADPQARDLVAKALDANLIDPAMLRPEDVEDRYHRGRAEVNRPAPQDWLEEYRELYEEEMRARADEFLMESGMVEGLRATARQRIGRNDPCWCGSGKKYKNCHLQADYNGET
jgi:hypothetical protein